ncbi:MAG: imidazole glycerol phosphate synthase subunit HisH [Betaproteobacteria bacterium]|nr:MAG: imidazole glycerol phosphate synthase subunit HisH [Betaproteobacteria bacterium]
MNKRVIVVDYGSGNLLSVCRALAHCGADVVASSEPSELAAADRLVLPGVGAFHDAMAALEQRALIDPIRGFIAAGRPFLGICVGMQILFEISEEFGEHRGLGILRGRVSAIPRKAVDGRPQKVPHIGWASLQLPDAQREGAWNDTIFREIPIGAAMYFVHSFAASPAVPSVCLADAIYGGRRLTAAVHYGRVYGTQFHPEKSGPNGLTVLNNFISIQP